MVQINTVIKPRKVLSVDRIKELQKRPSTAPLMARSCGDQFCDSMRDASPKFSPRIVTCTGAADAEERRRITGGEKDVMMGGRYEKRAVEEDTACCTTPLADTTASVALLFTPTPGVERNTMVVWLRTVAGVCTLPQRQRGRCS